MSDDKTILKTSVFNQDEFSSDRTVIYHPGLEVVLLNPDGTAIQTYVFADGFTAGRAQDNDIVIDNGNVSRHHLAVKHEQGEWWIYDLNSANGLYLFNNLIEQKARLSLPASVSLGKAVAFLTIQEQGKRVENPVATVSNSTRCQTESLDKTSERSLSREEIKARYLSDQATQDVGEFTQMFRTLIHEDRVNRGKSYKKWIYLLLVLFVLSAGLVAYQRFALSNARTLAIDMFYDIKALEVNLSQSEIMIEKSAAVLEQTISAVAKNKELKAEHALIEAEQKKIAAENGRLAQQRKRLVGMKAKYQEYVKEAESLRFRFSLSSRYEEELITRVAREFGESELEVPDDFVAEVKRYISYWKSSSRMQQAMSNLEKNHYAPAIIAALEQQGLPLHLIYLPLQESNYDTLAIGPETAFGVAKGAWQFLATTGQEFGLTSGPLAALREYDAQDERFDFNQATQAGSKYLKQIYSTEAQASGLLVVASYNYGHNRVKTMIRNMSDNPRDKNFWKFIQQYQIPKETYDYVFYIFSAAVIGEDPGYFGFKFKSPLASSAARKKTGESG
jgi:pSer/pThr/pTyr-binding forkhead associated (FHA) protein/soluble lytic murein transglycosylase-like protein